MATRNFKFNDIKIQKGDMKIDIKMDRFESQFGKAQLFLDTYVMADMVPYMPRVTGSFINLTRARSAAIAGTGEVVAAAPPYGRFLYNGKVMVDQKTGSPWARQGAKKVVTDRDIKYTNPKATPKWFETAKQKRSDYWIDGVKRFAGGG